MLMRVKETSTRCSTVIPPSPIIHPGAGPREIWASCFAFEGSKMGARDRIMCAHHEFIYLQAYFAHKVLNLELVRGCV